MLRKQTLTAPEGYVPPFLKRNSEESPPVYPPAVYVLIKKAALLPAQNTSKGLTAPLDNTVHSVCYSYLSILIYGKQH